MKETLQFELEPDPPLKDQAWFEGLEAAFDKLNEEWEHKYYQEEEADMPGPYNNANVSFLENPANFLSTGSADEYLNMRRLAHLARLKGEQNSTLAYTGVPSANVRFDYEGRGNWSEEKNKRSGWTIFGEEYWGQNFELEGTMNANVDPWFCAAQGDHEVGDVYEGEWVDKTIENHIQSQLKELEEMYKRDEGNKTETEYIGYQDSLDPQWDKFMYEHVDRPMSMMNPLRLSSVFDAGNAWAKDANYSGDKEWNPATASRVWTMSTKTSVSLNTFATESALKEEFFADAGWQDPEEDKHQEIQSSPEEEGAERGPVFGFVRMPTTRRLKVVGDMVLNRSWKRTKGVCPNVPCLRVSKLRLNSA
eukprot:765524-Hanusia_phi.AAC.4